ncbi:unnamed protein product [Symbiodinium sp. CCMP2592]|nr:unnamed protein product [Symbiodinium sp. CCMP2592]
MQKHARERSCADAKLAIPIRVRVSHGAVAAAFGCMLVQGEVAPPGKLYAEPLEDKASETQSTDAVCNLPRSQVSEEVHCDLGHRAPADVDTHESGAPKDSQAGHHDEGSSQIRGFD